MPIQIVHAGLDDFLFFLFIVGGILIRVVTAARANKSQAKGADSQKPPRPDKSPAEKELADFLREITGQEKQADAKPPPQQPVAAPPKPPPPVFNKQIRPEPARSTVKGPPKPGAQKPVGPAVNLRSIRGTKPIGITPAMQRTPKKSKMRNKPVLAMLKDNEALKQAIVLREILGPPRALKGFQR